MADTTELGDLTLDISARRSLFHLRDSSANHNGDGEMVVGESTDERPDTNNSCAVESARHIQRLQSD